MKNIKSRDLEATPMGGGGGGGGGDGQRQNQAVTFVYTLVGVTSAAYQHDVKCESSFGCSKMFKSVLKSNNMKISKDMCN